MLVLRHPQFMKLHQSLYNPDLFHYFPREFCHKSLSYIAFNQVHILNKCFILLTEKHFINFSSLQVNRHNTRVVLSSLVSVCDLVCLSTCLSTRQLPKQKICTRGAPDPEFCYLAGSGSMPDPDMSDPVRSEPDPSHLAPVGSKPWLLPTTGEKLFFLHHNWKSWNDCLTYFVTELLLE